MKPHLRFVIGAAAAIVAGFWWCSRSPEPTILAFRLGQTFEQVVKDSTYPVMEHSIRPADSPSDDKFGATYVDEPAVIIRFTDPKHGFTLPPTKFAALTFSENQAVSLATSPMLAPKGKQRFYARMFEPGYMESNSLRVPKMYGMTFRLKCTEGCWTREPPYLFLIDVGVGDDVYGREPGEPRRWQRPETAATGSSVQ